MTSSTTPGPDVNEALTALAIEIGVTGTYRIKTRQVPRTNPIDPDASFVLITVRAAGEAK